MNLFKTHTRSVIYFLTLVMALGLGACAKKSSSSNSRIQAGRGDGQIPVGNTIGGGNTFSQSCQGNGSQYARMVSQGNDMRSAFQDFLQTELGDLDGSGSSSSTGVDVQLRIKTVNGQVSASESSISIWVVDSVAAQDSSQEIEVNYRGAQTVQGNANGEFTLVFRDSYGDVIVQGRNQGNVVTAQVLYKNTNMSQAQSLGSFSQNSCSVWF